MNAAMRRHRIVAKSGWSRSTRATSSPGLLHLLQSGARNRVVMVVFVGFLALDLGSTGICCADAPVSVTGSVASSNAPTPASDSAPHVDDNCFCCARSEATSLTTWGPLEGMAFDVPPSRRALQLSDLPPLYHPPQSHA